MIKFFTAYLSKFSPAQITVVSFAVLSLLGGFALWYTEKDRSLIHDKAIHKEVSITIADAPQGSEGMEQRREIHTFIMEHKQKGESFTDMLFIAVSALCVTGLTSTDFSQFTLPGKIITLFLIQIGGIGIIVAMSLLALAISRGISEHAAFRRIVGNILETQHNEIVTMIKHIVIYVISFETVGAIVLGSYFQWFADKTLLEGINPWWWGFFHAISAFNNAGFSLTPTSLTNFVTDPIVNIVISVLIIVGGFGYPVLIGMHVFLRSKLLHKNDKNQQSLLRSMKAVAASTVQLRVAIVGTVIFLIVGALIPFLDASNGLTFSHFSISQQLMIAFFQSVATRSGGFTTIDIGTLGVGTLLLYITLMYIGANPAGTGGGIKIPTVAVLYGYIKDWFAKPGLPIRLLGKNVSRFAVSHAIRLFFISIITIVLLTILISLIEGQWLITPDPTVNLLKIVFEIVSAFSTVGLSMGYEGGVTSFSGILSTGSKLLIIIAMLIGRLGPLVVLAALPWKKELREEEHSPDYPDAERIQIG
ncbi:MAG: potassium transporter TrkG [Patescibacteria group bacterium]